MTDTGWDGRPLLEELSDDIWWRDPPVVADESSTNRAEDAVRSLGIHTPWVTYETYPLTGGLIQVRVVNPGEFAPAGGSPSWVVTPDSRVFEVRAVPGTTLDTAEEVLAARYTSCEPVDDDEAGVLQTAIEVLARRRAMGM